MTVKFLEREAVKGLQQNIRRSISEKWLTILLFTLPAAAMYIFFVLFPVARAVQYSLYEWNGLGPLEDFVGLRNFARIFRDPVFRLALRNNFLIAFLSLTIQIPFALGVAYMLNSRLRMRTFFRMVFFMPFVISEVIAAIIFNYIFRTKGGLVNLILEYFGLPAVLWLANPKIVIYTVFIALTWKYFGYHMIILLAGLQNIPQELIEAAQIDGASGWQVFRRVVVPLLGPTLRLSMYLSLIGSIQVFDLVWAMTGGGPVNASTTMAITMYRAGFQRQLLGYASAVAIVIFLLTFTISIVLQRSVMREDLEVTQ